MRTFQMQKENAGLKPEIGEELDLRGGPGCDVDDEAANVQPKHSVVMLGP